MAAALRTITLAFVLTYSLLFGPGTAFASGKRAIAQKAFRFKVTKTPWFGLEAVSATPAPIGVRAVAYAKRFLGTPYVWGGSSPGGFDCSGLVRYVYEKFGIDLPHSSYADFDLGRPVGRWALEPGDLVFFNGLGHVGLYIGHGRFIHAPHTGTTVQISTLSNSWGGYDGARRIVSGAKRRLLHA